MKRETIHDLLLAAAIFVVFAVGLGVPAWAALLESLCLRQIQATPGLCDNGRMCEPDGWGAKVTPKQRDLHQTN